MSYLVLATSHSIEMVSHCPHVNVQLKCSIIYMKTKTELKCTLNTNPGLVCDLVDSFLQFFHFVQNSCQSHNGLISSRPSWRQWAGFGLVQDLWFGLGLCGLWSAEKYQLF